MEPLGKNGEAMEMMRADLTSIGMAKHGGYRRSKDSMSQGKEMSSTDWRRQSEDMSQHETKWSGDAVRR